MFALFRSLLRRLYCLLADADPCIAALFALLLLYYVLTPGIFEGKASGDGLLGFLYLPGFALHHSPDLRFTVPDRIYSLGVETTGRVANPCPIGPVFIWAPFYLLGLLLQKLHVVTTPAAQRFGQTTVDYFVAGLGTLFFAQMGIAATSRFVRRHMGPGRGPARFAIVVAVLATPLCFYLVTQPLYQHGCAFAAVALFIERWDAWALASSNKDGYGTWRDALWLGTLGGIAMLMRIQEAIFLFLPGLTLLGHLGRALRQRNGPAALAVFLQGALILLAAALLFLPQALLWLYFYAALKTPQASGHMRWTDPAFIETLFSLRAGLFPWVPALYVALPGLLLFPLRRHAIGARLGVVFLLCLWINASAWDYHGSWAFGPRRFTDCTPIFAAGLASAYAWLRDKRRLYPFLLASWASLLLAYNGLLMEAVRTRRIKSSSSGAYPAAQWARWLHAPPAIEKALARFGYPFAQPAGWLYAAWYSIPPSAFEGIVGNYFLERDWRLRSYIIGPRSVSLREPSPYLFRDRGQTPGTEQRRLLLPLYIREPLEVRLRPTSHTLPLSAADIRVVWNGHPLPLSLEKGMLGARVPAEWIHSRARLNQVMLEAPRAALPDSLELVSYTDWWHPEANRR